MVILGNGIGKKDQASGFPKVYIFVLYWKHGDTFMRTSTYMSEIAHLSFYTVILNLSDTQLVMNSQFISCAG